MKKNLCIYKQYEKYDQNQGTKPYLQHKHNHLLTARKQHKPGRLPESPSYVSFPPFMFFELFCNEVFVFTVGKGVLLSSVPSRAPPQGAPGREGQPACPARRAGRERGPGGARPGPLPSLRVARRATPCPRQRGPRTQRRTTLRCGEREAAAPRWVNPGPAVPGTHAVGGRLPGRRRAGSLVLNS